VEGKAEGAANAAEAANAAGLFLLQSLTAACTTSSCCARPTKFGAQGLGLGFKVQGL